MLTAFNKSTYFPLGKKLILGDGVLERGRDPFERGTSMPPGISKLESGLAVKRIALQLFSAWGGLTILSHQKRIQRIY